MKIHAFCGYPFQRLRVTCEGNVAMCCFMRPDPMKEEKDAYIGNVLENSFDEIWFGDTAESIRNETLEGRLHEKCRTPGCPFASTKPPYKKQEIIYNEYPTFLEIDLPNTHCNVGGKSPDPVKSPACIMCERAAPFFRPETNHLFEVLEKIKRVVPNLRQIHIQGIAEPLYQTRENGFLLFDVLDVLDFDKYADKITLSITTNGTLFKKEVRAEYLRRAPHSITNFSIDAATPETFKQIRIFDCFDKVLSNLYDFSKERVRNRQFLRIHNNINILNIHEVLGMVHIAHAANVEYIEFSPTDGFNHKILVNKNNCGRFKRAQNLIIEECNRLGVPYNFIRPLDMGLSEDLVQLGM
jgi:MoaA/NifB/PqqE/SkfB family radical SAM enzyme